MSVELNLNICRVCLESNELNFKSIFSNRKYFNEAISCVDMILSCANVTVSADDNLPSNICDQCLTKLKIAYTFRKKCESSFEYLQRTLYQNMEASLDPVTDMKDDEMNEEHYEDLSSHFEVQNFNLSLEPEVEIEEMDRVEVARNRFKKNSNRIKIDQKKYGYFITTGVEDVDVEADYLEALYRMYKHTCELCPRRYAVKSYLQSHINCHLGIKPYYCEMCKKNYADEKTHIKFHNQKRSKGECKCLVCEKAYSSVYALRSHMKEHTGEKKWYPCSQCPRKFNQRGKLLIHMPVHTREKNYMCKACNKPFRFEKNLAVHFQAMHTTNRPHKCDMCDKAYVTSNALNFHKRTHLGIRRHTCTMCPLSYYSTSDLRRHKKVHDDGSAFRCETCGACYARQYILDRHIKQDHATMISDNTNENSTQNEEDDIKPECTEETSVE